MFLCAIPVPGVCMGGCWELACVGFVPATVLVCQDASRPCAWLYPVTAPFLHAVCYCSFEGVLSLSVCSSFTSAVLQISGSCLYFATPVLCLVVCVVPESCKFHERLKLLKAETIIGPLQRVVSAQHLCEAGRGVSDTSRCTPPAYPFRVFVHSNLNRFDCNR